MHVLLILKMHLKGIWDDGMLLKITESGITGNVSSILKDTVQYVPRKYMLYQD